MSLFIVANRGDRLTGRQIFDITIGVWQVLPRVTDLVRLLSFPYQAFAGSAAGKEVRRKCGMADTLIVSIPLTTFIIGRLVLQAEELNTSQHRNDDETKVALKGVQLLLSACNGLLAWPREEIKKRELEAAMAFNRRLIQFLKRPFII